MFQNFTGTDDYIASVELQEAVNVALALERPLIVKGEPGTGKTLLAHSIAQALDRPLHTWHVKSTSRAQEGLYVYDAVQRLHDSRFSERDVGDLRQYIRFGALGQAFTDEKPSVVLIDEVDKADMEFPNDLLHELDRMSFTVMETGDVHTARNRPLVIITSNNEKELPDAFLRRCIFHFIAFPDTTLMAQIVKVHHPNVRHTLVDEAIARFYWLRNVPELRKQPSTSELIDWIAALAKGGIDPEHLTERIPYLGTLLKKEQDLDTLERFKQRRRRG
ncbi:MAG: MoxR family ATPase [Myxococcota bacterium]|nr:MoxR family ATPase [Myxococcota bacterium]